MGLTPASTRQTPYDLKDLFISVLYSFYPILLTALVHGCWLSCGGLLGGVRQILILKRHIIPQVRAEGFSRL